MWVSYTDNQCEQKQLHARRSAGAGESKEIDMELIGKQIAIETILGQPPELHYPSWYAAQIEKLPPAPPEYLAEQAGILVTDSDTISRAKAIEALKSCYCGGEDSCGEPWIYENSAIDAIKQLLPAQPEPSQVAKDIARIVGNEQDMRVIRPEIIYCKDCKKQNRHYHESPYKDTVCPLTAWRGTAQGHEYDYQFCCFAERREVTECLD